MPIHHLSAYAPQSPVSVRECEKIVLAISYTWTLRAACPIRRSAIKACLFYGIHFSSNYYKIDEDTLEVADSVILCHGDGALLLHGFEYGFSGEYGLSNGANIASHIRRSKCAGKSLGKMSPVWGIESTSIATMGMRSQSCLRLYFRAVLRRCRPKIRTSARPRRSARDP